MANLRSIELTCSYTVVTTAPLNPFVWAILRVLRALEAGARPDFETLSEKLKIGEPAFLHSAWGECRNCGLVDAVAGDYQTAQITVAGERALDDGYLEVAAPEHRNGETLYFRFDNGDAIRWASHFRIPQESRRPVQRPKWADSLTAVRIAEAIAAQYEDKERHITGNKRLKDLAVDWGQSFQVLVSTDRQA